MDLALLRLAVAPSAVWVASAAQRRSGHRAGGRLVGLPLTTGPFLLVLCLGPGPDTAARAAAGTVAGEISVVAYCLTYGWLAARWSWPGVLAASLLAALGSALLLTAVAPPPWVSMVVVLAAIGGGLAASIPPLLGVAGMEPPRWETPLRMAMCGGIVAVLALATPRLGPFLAGALSTAPAILSVMAPATHRVAGPGAAAAVVRGSLVSMASTVVFVTVAAYALGPLGTWPGLAVAVLALVATDRLNPFAGASGARRRVPQSPGH